MALAAPGVGVATPRPNPDADLRLLCFPYAGGGSSAFVSWPERLAPAIEVTAVQLPGRESRIMQRPFSDIWALVPALGEAVLPYCRKPLAFFGHSMGAIVAFELARWLRAQGLPEPVHLFVSARRAPHLPHPRPPGHLLRDDQLIERVRELGGMPDGMLTDARLMTALLPLLRADFAVNDTYRYRSEPPLVCPITATGGLGDADVGRQELAAWRRHTRGPFRLSMFRGAHFYLRDSQEALLAMIRDVLAARAGRARAGLARDRSAAQHSGNQEREL